jgi:hypothetical protein
VQLWERLRAWLELVQHVTTPPELQALGMSGLRKQVGTG